MFYSIGPWGAFTDGDVAVVFAGRTDTYKSHKRYVYTSDFVVRLWSLVRLGHDFRIVVCFSAPKKIFFFVILALPKNRQISIFEIVMWKYLSRFFKYKLHRNAQGGGIFCKHDARWHHVSRLKARTFCSWQKKTEVNKTHQLIPGISTAILGVMEPHWIVKSEV